MQTYWRLKILCAAVLFFYAAAAIVIKISLPDEREIFPLFSWSLFSTVPGEDTNYGLRILACNGQVLNPPVFFEDAKDLFPNANYAQVFMTVQRLGRAVDNANGEDITMYRNLLERYHLRGRKKIHYEIVRRDFNTLARWQTGEIKSIRAVRAFWTES